MVLRHVQGIKTRLLGDRSKEGWFGLSEHDLASHGAIIGSSGSGKTETLLRMAYLAARVYEWQVWYLDAKGDTETAIRFLAMMWSAGRQDLHLFPAEAYNGWVGGATDLLNRFLAIEQYTEPYYKGIAQRMLSLVMRAPKGPPRSTQTFLSWLHQDKLLQEYTGKTEFSDVQGIPVRDAASVLNRYSAFFDLVGDRLDGSFSFDDGDGGYILLDGLALSEQAASLGRFLMEDYAHSVAKRKPRSRRTLLIIDEYSALDVNTSSASNLFERIRSYNAAIWVSGHSYEALGAGAERILAAGNTIIVHRCGNPKRLVERAGMRKEAHASHVVMNDAPSGRGTVQARDVPIVSPDDVSRLATGEAYCIRSGEAHRFRVARVPEADAGAMQRARRLVEGGPKPPRLIIPPPSKTPAPNYWQP
jgi:hypothetical protein